MALYKAVISNNKIEVNELNVTKESDKRYYIDNQTWGYVDKYKIDKEPLYSYSCEVFSLSKEKAVQIMRNYFEERIAKIKADIERYEKILKNSEN